MKNYTPIMISVVVPVYGCKNCLEQLAERIQVQMQKMNCTYELIFVDDRSPDLSWETIEYLVNNSKNIVGIRLSRNFGQHLAIVAGLKNAKGEYAIVMDCDLQDPPELIPTLYNEIKKGYDLILSKRIERNNSLYRTILSKGYFYFLSLLFQKKIESHGTFSILNRKVINAFLLFNESEQHYVFILSWLGFSQGLIEYKHEARYEGNSSYNLKSLIKHALNGIVFQTTSLLKFIVLIGGGFSFLGILLMLYFIYRYFSQNALPGWTSLFTLIMTATGFILMSLGVTALYVGKIFTQTKMRPIYIQDQVIRNNVE